MSAVLPPVFKLERFFAQYQFCAKYLGSCSDGETIGMQELLNMADDECKELWENMMLCYTDTKGHHLLRKEIATFHQVEPEDVLVVVPQEGILIAMTCLADHLRRKHNLDRIHVISTYPGYQSLYQNPETLNCDVSYWTGKFDATNGWGFSMSEFKSMIKPETKLVVVNFPHNPTGFMPSNDEWDEIVGICRSRGIFLFSDEMYRCTNHDGSQSPQSACAVYEDAITLCGMSKIFAMPGLRLGWVCTKNADVMTMMQRYKDYVTICAPGPCEVLSIIGLRNREELLERTMEIVRQNIKIFQEVVSEYPEVLQWQEPRSCTISFFRLKGWGLKLGSGGATGFCDVMVKESGVMMVPSSVYNYQPDEYVRVGFGRKNFLRVMEEFRRFLDSHNK